MTSSGKLSSQSLTSWLRYGFGTVLDPLRWLVSLRESSGPASRSALRAFERAEFRSARELQEGREERERAARASSFQLSGLDAAHRRLIEPDCPYGAELHPCPWFSCKAFSMEKRITFDPCIKLLSSLHIYNITTFVIVLIHEVLQPFIKV